MRKGIKSLVSMLLVFVIVFAMAPSTAYAGTIKVQHGYSGYVKCVYYAGGPSKSAAFTISSNLVAEDYNGYDLYDVTITITKPNFSKKDTLGIYNDLQRKGTNRLLDYVPIFTNKNGGVIKVKRQGGLQYYTDPVRSYSKKGKRKIWVSHSKYNRYEYRLYIPANKTGYYVGVAGLGHGQITTVNYKKYLDGKLTYGGAGFGSSKKGYAVIGRIS